jgi:hypothetical protein
MLLTSANARVFAGIIVLLLSGCISSIILKTIFTAPVTVGNGHTEYFQKPWLMSFLMFVGMSTALLVEKVAGLNQAAFVPEDTEDSPLMMSHVEHKESTKILSLRKICVSVVPAVFDALSAGTAYTSLLFVPLSIYQLLRGAQLLFSFLLSCAIIQHPCHVYHVIGMCCCIAGMVLVGLSAVAMGGAVKCWAIALSLLSELLAAFEVISREYVMKEYKMTELQITGVVGIWGMVLMIIFAFPLVYFLPGNDHGSIENESDSLLLLQDNTTIWKLLVIYTFNIAVYNIISNIGIASFSAVHVLMTENLRTVLTWLFALSFHYCINPASDLGESWSKNSYLELLGMVFLVMGQVIHHGILRLPCIEYQHSD